MSRAVIGPLTLAIAALLAACGGTTSPTSPTSPAVGPGATGGQAADVSPTATDSSGAPTCPTAAVVAQAMGSAVSGPVSNDDTAACVYDGSGQSQVTVVFLTPQKSESQFVSQDPAAIGQPATALSGLGAAAFGSTAYGHAEVDVYQSSSAGFSVTVDNGTPTVTAAMLTQAEAVARAVAGSS